MSLTHVYICEAIIIIKTVNISSLQACLNALVFPPYDSAAHRPYPLPQAIADL